MERWTSTSFAPSASCQLVVTAALRHWRQVTFLTGARSVPSIAMKLAPPTSGLASAESHALGDLFRLSRQAAPP